VGELIVPGDQLLPHVARLVVEAREDPAHVGELGADGEPLARRSLAGQELGREVAHAGGAAEALQQDDGMGVRLVRDGVDAVGGRHGCFVRSRACCLFLFLCVDVPLAVSLWVESMLERSGQIFHFVRFLEDDGWQWEVVELLGVGQVKATGFGKRIETYRGRVGL